MTLLDFAKTKEALIEITGFAGESMFCERLHEMGLREGMLIRILGRAPFGGPILIRYNTSFLALRNAEAACALVKGIDR